MQVLSHNSDPVRLFWRRVLLLFLTIMAVLGTSGVWRIYVRERESAILDRESQTHLAELTAREVQLKKDIANLTTDRGREAVLREQYQMGKPGEGLIIIVNPPTPVVPHATSSPLVEWFKTLFPWW